MNRVPKGRHLTKLGGSERSHSCKSAQPQLSRTPKYQRFARRSLAAAKGLRFYGICACTPCRSPTKRLPPSIPPPELRRSRIQRMGKYQRATNQQESYDRPPPCKRFSDATPPARPPNGPSSRTARHGSATPRSPRDWSGL